MAVQFSGSSSTGDRRRRRLAVSGDGSGVDASLSEGDVGEIESQLVASAAAAPWVPVSETRIWIYAFVIGVGLGVLIFALARPDVFHTELTPLANHLFAGSRPTAVVCAETLLLALSTQLGLLIGWYRARCKLDFAGRYRVWPWVVGLIATAAFCLATNTHHAFAEVVGRGDWLPWRGQTVAWLLPFCVAALPIALLLDRDMRNSRSSLFTMRISGLLWLTSASFELYQPELQSNPWFPFAHLLVPLFASVTLFVALWLHARIVAYVCPDPPELDQQSAWSLAMVALGWIGRRLMFWRTSNVAVQDDEDSKPKRRRKKVESDEAATKRKRKPAAKRTTSRTRTRAKSAEDDEVEESGEEASNEDYESSNESVEESSVAVNSSQDEVEQPSYEEPDDEAPAPVSAPNGNGRFTQIHKSHGSSVPAPHSRRQTSWQDETESESEYEGAATSPASESSDESDEDRQMQADSGMTNEQMKGMSKRQKRELRKQLRDQERARGR